MNVGGSYPAWTILSGAPASASTSYSSVTSKAATGSAPRTKQSRITKEGYRLVDELYQSNPYPTRDQKNETLTKIQALPGCGHYTYVNLNSRLHGHRKRDAETGIANSGGLRKDKYIARDATTTAQILYPTLLNDKNTIPYLVILWKEAPCPTSTQIKLWAKQLKVQESDIRAWMELELDNQRQSTNRVATTQLPTPASSCSPEPASPITPTSPSYPVLPPFASLDAKPVSRAPLANKPSGAFLSREQFQDLAEKVHVARTTSEAMLLSSEDAVKALDEHSERMLAFIQRYERGEYATLGMSPQLLGGASVSMPLKAEPSSPI
ncbi:hypothetical protein FOMPIDRAFT_1049611 [Fomitopsis schrenkii]|uniref:Homeobox domain-containing protein n=1 Tax=Fomitopsis schrenkii TaxID=2126942 RepID=S8EBB0_FOMSC|nr:hypothetical protein FOMPIDRAFT_1049611 [Fomitopsis schrenkii]